MSIISQNKLEFQTKEDYVFEVLRESILNCDFKSGEKLVIDQISQEMGISTIPIRAAIQRLGMEGLVDIRSHAPAHVAQISLNMIQEVFSLLAALEGVAFKVVAEKADPEQISVLEGLAREMDQAIEGDDLRSWAKINITFHRQIAEFAMMPMLVEFTRRIFDQWRRLSNHYFKDVTATRIHLAQDEHWQILKLIKEKESEKLISLANLHNQAAFESYQSLITKE